jgi:CHAT domain-containing protein
VRRPLAWALALTLAGCAGMEGTPQAGSGHREGRRSGATSAPRVTRDPAATGAWDGVQTRVRRGESPAVLADAQRDASAAEAAGEHAAASFAHAAAAYAALRLSRLDVVVRESRAAIREADQAGDWPGRQLYTARSHRFIAIALRHLGRPPEEAERELQAALTAGLVANAGRPHVGIVSNVKSSLGILAAARGDYAAATKYGEDVVEALERSLHQARLRTNPQRNMSAQRQLAAAELNLADIYQRAGRVDDTERLAKAGLGNAKAVGAPDFETKAHATLAFVARKRGDPRGPTLYAEALEAARRTSQVSLQVSLHSGLAQLHADAGRPAEALESARRAMDLVESIRGRLQEADLRSSFFEGKQELYQNSVRLALQLGQAGEGFALAERSRARAFLDLLGTHTALSKGSTQALAAEDLRLRARLAAARAGDLVEDEEGETAVGAGAIAAAERAYADFLNAVRAASPEQASLMSVEPVTLAEVQALLEEGTTLLEYLVTPNEVVVWVVDRSRSELVRIRVPRAAVLNDVRAFRKAIADLAPAAEVERRAEALHRQLVAPVRAHVRGDRVVVVPHDVLHYLPFAALRSPQGRWLIEDWRLSTVPSASVLKYLGGKGSAARGPAVAIGNPELGPDFSLRFAEREAQAVADAFPGARVFVRGAATEREAKTLAPTASVLHFATHAELDEKDPLASALLLVGGGGEDGRLEVRELFRLDLNARLVVLSACETGLGQLSRGDELVGLQRAFLYAGTPAVVTTLWKVDDRASFVLMRRFYEALASNGPAEALRRAQRASLAEQSHPFFWAAFSLAGHPG